MKKSKLKPLLILALLISTSLAANISAATLSRDFFSDEKLAKGTIVSLDQQASKVLKSNFKNLHNMFGVVVEEGDISFKRQADQQIVAVANEGVMDTLVSTANGEIKSGDPITVRSVEGVGEKATQNGRIVGIAQDNFSAQSSNGKNFTIDQEGSKKDIVVGLLPVKLGVTDYTLSNPALGTASEQERNWIERIADSFAGKEVKPIALIAAGLVLVSGVFIATFLITSSSFASVISIGRNPFARKNIITSLIGLIALSVGIFASSIALAYLILRVLG